MRLTKRILRTTPLLLLAAMLTACSSGPAPFRTDAGTDAAPRAAVDALDRATAEVRAARLSAIRYDVAIDLVTSTTVFGGEVTIFFDLADAGSDLTIDFSGGTVESMQVNDESVEADYNGFFITVPAAALRVGQNYVHVDYQHPYDEDGTGLHRFVDPEDDRTYLYTYLWPYYANRLLPSFDQPDLKAEFSLRVLAPADWIVVSASPGSAAPAGDAGRRWTFSPTPRISTYFFSLHAGPYAIWESDASGIPLRLMARRSLAGYVAIDEWFELTRRGIAFYGDFFDVPYPFEKYDQLIVPEFNISGMENAAAVTYTENLVQRQPSDQAQRYRRAETVLHELAHMWFGDFVTHEWWNGMWLNESFATQMASMAAAEVTEFGDSWHAFFVTGKGKAYLADSRVTSHPIEMNINTTAEFYTVFDAITYEKGASVLKQLQHLVGDDNYRRGVASYMNNHAWGNTQLADFIAYQEAVSGADLEYWTEDWLLRPGFDTLAAEATCAQDTLVSLAISQTAPSAQPYLRAHQVDVALYVDDGAGGLSAAAVLPARIDGARTEVPVRPGLPCPVLINPNHNDWAFARIALRDADRIVLRERIADVVDPLGRSLFLAALADEADAGEISIADFVDQALRLAEREQNPRVLEQATGSIVRSITLMQRLRPETEGVLDSIIARIERLALEKAHFATQRDIKYLWLNTFLNVVSSWAGLGTCNALLDGRAEIDGIEMSPELRWQLLTILSRNDVPGSDEKIDAELARDASDFAVRRALAARAAKPDAAVKARWLDELVNPNTVTALAQQRAIMSELFPPSQTQLQLPLLETILTEIPRLDDGGDIYFLSFFTTNLLPPTCRQESAEKIAAALGDYGAQLQPTTLRFMREAQQAETECAALRAIQ